MEGDPFNAFLRCARVGDMAGMAALAADGSAAVLLPARMGR